MLYCTVWLADSFVTLFRYINWNRNEKKDVHPVLIATLFVCWRLHEKNGNTSISSECHLPNYTSQWWIVEIKLAKYLCCYFWCLTVLICIYRLKIMSRGNLQWARFVVCMCRCCSFVFIFVHMQNWIFLFRLRLSIIFWVERIIIAWQANNSITEASKCLFISFTWLKAHWPWVISNFVSNILFQFVKITWHGIHSVRSLNLLHLFTVKATGFRGSEAKWARWITEWITKCGCLHKNADAHQQKNGRFDDAIWDEWIESINKFKQRF